LNRWDGRSVTRDGRLIESEENRAEEGGGLFVRIGLEVRMDIDDEGGADGREQTGLRTGTGEIIEKSGGGQRTKISVMLRSSSYFLT